MAEHDGCKLDYVFNIFNTQSHNPRVLTFDSIHAFYINTLLHISSYWLKFLKCIHRMSNMLISKGLKVIMFSALIFI